MTAEYEALRAEMLAWQNRRFTILTASIALVTGILGLDSVTGAASGIHWAVVTSLLFFLLGAAAALIWHAGQANAKAAAYIIVFHESESEGWESRLKRLKDRGFNRLNLNRMMVLIFLGLGMIAFFIPTAVRKDWSVGDHHSQLVGVSGIWFVFGMILLLSSSGRDHYVRSWKNLDKAKQESGEEND